MILPEPHQDLAMEHLPTPDPDAADSARRLGQRGETSRSPGTNNVEEVTWQVVEAPGAPGSDHRRLRDEEGPPYELTPTGHGVRADQEALGRAYRCYGSSAFTAAAEPLEDNAARSGARKWEISGATL
jgi:hypothetical protein